MKVISTKIFRRRRSIVVLFIALVISFLSANPNFLSSDSVPEAPLINTEVLSEQTGTKKASDVLKTIPVKGRAVKTGYSRTKFTDGWAKVGGCNMRDIMLRRGMTNVKLSTDGCIVLSGDLADPYTGKLINFRRGSSTSNEVQIDHVVALSDAWQKGAQQLDYSDRLKLANDPLNLLAVDGPANQQKGDSDAASWLPPNKSYRCMYVARQIAVKSKYHLWISSAEKNTIIRILNGCGEQVLPIES